MSSVVSLHRPDKPYRRAQRSARYIAVCSGHEGVGKSSVTVNLAIVLARMGHRVCILDADPGVANVHTLLGLESIQTLANVIDRDCTMAEAMVKGPAGIQLLTDGNHLSLLAEREDPQRHHFLNELSDWEARLDYVFIDTPSANSDAIMPYIDAADDLLLVLTPEPTSLSDAFSLLNHALRRRTGKHIHVVVNQAQGSDRASRAFERFSTTVRKYLSTNVIYSGHIGLDETIRNAFTLQHPVALYPSNDPSCERFFQLAKNFEAQLTPLPKNQGGLAELIANLPLQAAENIVDAAAAFNQDHTPLAEPDTLPREQKETSAPKARRNLDSELFQRVPMLARQLIDDGQIDAEGYKIIIDQLRDIGRLEFPLTFASETVTATTTADDQQPLDGFQSKLLGNLRDNRDSGRTLDELLSAYVTENS